MYKIEKNLNKLNKNQPTFFLDPKEQLELSKKRKKIHTKYTNHILIVKKTFFIQKKNQK